MTSPTAAEVKSTAHQNSQPWHRAGPQKNVNTPRVQRCHICNTISVLRLLEDYIHWQFLRRFSFTLVDQAPDQLVSHCTHHGRLYAHERYLKTQLLKPKFEATAEQTLSGTPALSCSHHHSHCADANEEGRQNLFFLAFREAAFLNLPGGRIFQNQ